MIRSLYLCGQSDRRMKKPDPIHCIRAEADQAQIERGRAEIENFQKQFNELVAVLALAGNEVRLKILYLLSKEQELCPCDLADILKKSVPSVSQHLWKMRDGRIIISRKEGKTIYYSLENEALKDLKPMLENLQIPSKKEVTISNL